MRGHAGCWRLRRRATGWTSACGPAPRPLPAPAATPRALVGTPAQVADALLDYWRLGVDRFLIRGFDPLEDAVDYGRELIPLLRQMIAAEQAKAKPARRLA